MIGSKAKSHANFKGLIGYQLQLEKCSEYRTYNLFAEEPGGIANEMKLTLLAANKGRPDNKKITTPTYHISFSWPDEDTPTTEQMLAVGEDFLSHMELGEYQSVIAVHRDTNHKHIHVVANRVHPAGGPLWEEWKWRDTPEGRRCEATHHQRVETFERAMEKEFGWRIEPGRHAGAVERTFDGRAPKLWEIKKQDDKQEIAATMGQKDSPADFRTPKLKADELKNQLFKAKTFTAFDEILAGKDLWLEKRGQGVVITDGYDSVPGSHVSRAFSKGKLEAKFKQDFEKYSASRENYIHESVGDRMVTKALAIQLIMNLEKTRGLKKGELKRVEREFLDINQSPEVNNIRKEIKAGFKKAYQDPDASYRAFLRYAESNGTFQAYEKQGEEPEYFGEIKNNVAAAELSEELRSFESQSLLAKTYIDTLLKESQKQSLINEKENLRSNYLDLTSQISTIKSQTNKVMVKMLAQTEEGRDLLQMRQKFRKTIRLVHKIISFHRSLKNLSKGGGPAFSRKLIKSIGVPGSTVALNSIQTCYKMLLKAPENNRNTDISR